MPAPTIDAEAPQTKPRLTKWLVGVAGRGGDAGSSPVMEGSTS
jgi:hypothetical protein